LAVGSTLDRGLTPPDRLRGRLDGFEVGFGGGHGGVAGGVGLIVVGVRGEVVGEDEFEVAVVFFDDGGAVFEPVAGVEVGGFAGGVEHRLVDVAAEDAVHLTRDGVGGELLFIFVEEELEFAEAFFEPAGEGVVVTGRRVAGPAEPAVGVEEFVVDEGGELGDEAAVAFVIVELVAVDDEEAFAVGGDVDELGGDLNGAGEELRRDIGQQVTHEFVVVAGGVEEFGAAVFEFGEAGEDLVVDGRPAPAVRQFATINGIANEVDGFGLEAVEQCEQLVGSTVSRAEVEVAEEESSNANRHPADPWWLRATLVLLSHH
jgi:hypothetical protein